MEAQSREQADYAVANSPAGFGQGMMFGQFGVGRQVEPAADPTKQPLLAEPLEVHSRYAERIETKLRPIFRLARLPQKTATQRSRPKGPIRMLQ